VATVGLSVDFYCIRCTFGSVLGLYAWPVRW
jgi:hypothetical protein